MTSTSNVGLANGGYPDYDLVLMYWANRSLSEPWFTLSAVAYSILILVTFLGNSLVIWAVARRKELWNPRNIFILNLAVSDICKCTKSTYNVTLVVGNLGWVD